jgi:hypothetical protein
LYRGEYRPQGRGASRHFGERGSRRAPLRVLACRSRSAISSLPRCHCPSASLTGTPNPATQLQRQPVRHTDGCLLRPHSLHCACDFYTRPAQWDIGRQDSMVHPLRRRRIHQSAALGLAVALGSGRKTPTRSQALSGRKSPQGLVLPCRARLTRPRGRQQPARLRPAGRIVREHKVMAERPLRWQSRQYGQAAWGYSLPSSGSAGIHRLARRPRRRWASIASSAGWPSGRFSPAARLICISFTPPPQNP